MQYQMKTHLSFSFLLATIITSIGCSALGQPGIDRLGPEAFQQTIDRSGPHVLLDVRTAEEFEEGHLSDAINYDIYDSGFIAKLKALDKNKPVFVYCKGGSRSLEAARQLSKLGFPTVYDLRGGVLAWEQDGFPLAGAAQKGTDTFGREDFNRLLSTHQRVLVDFYADWCMPCKKMEPEIIRLEKKYAGKVTVVRINVDKAAALSRELDIREIPVIATYRNGKELKRKTGYQSNQALQRLVKELR